MPNIIGWKGKKKMFIKDIFASKKPVLSFEVFPPKKTENLGKVKATVEKISRIPVDYMSVTYGAGGSTSKLTPEIAGYMQNDLNVTALAHLTCISLTKPEVKDMLETLRDKGIKNILALRGDIPAGAEFPLKDGYSYASELTEEIKKFGGFCVGGACYPECHPDCGSIDEDIENLKKKVDAGADLRFQRQMCEKGYKCSDNSGDNATYEREADREDVRSLRRSVHAVKLCKDNLEAYR